LDGGVVWTAVSTDDLGDRSKWVTPPKAARQIGVSPYLVRRLIAEGELPAVRIGSRWLISRAVLADYIARIRGQSA